MEKIPPKIQPDDLSAIHEPVDHLKVWLEEKIRILTSRPDGEPVELDSQQASSLADLLRRLCEPGLPDYPYEPPTSGYGALTYEICVGQGFCGCIKNGRPLHVDFLIPSRGPVTADQFVEWVYLGDGLNPNVDPGRDQLLKDVVRAAFVKHMGAEVVDAKKLRHEFFPADYEPDVKWRGPLPSVREPPGDD